MALRAGTMVTPNVRLVSAPNQAVATLAITQPPEPAAATTPTTAPRWPSPAHPAATGW